MLTLGRGAQGLSHLSRRNADTYGVLKLTLHPSSYDWQFVPESGKTFTDSSFWSMSLSTR
jgi:hypothetical protein